jgi:lysophospholipase L1-like esterase
MATLFSKRNAIVTGNKSLLSGGISGAVVITGPFVVGGTLTASITKLIAAGWTGTASYQWRRSASASDLTYANSVAISGATSAAYTQVSADEGRKLFVDVTGLNPPGTAAGVTAPAVVVGVAPGLITAPVVTSTPTVGQTISAQTYTLGTYSGTPAPVTALDSWLLDGSAVSTGYTLAAEDAGKGLQVKLTVSNGVLPNLPATSIAVAVQALVTGKVADPRIIIVGDSITHFGTSFSNTGAITFTRDAAGVVSVPLTNHQLTAGTPFSVVNGTNPEFEGLFVATVIDANNFTYQTTYTGNPTTMVGVGASTAINRHMKPNSVGYFRWLNGLCGGGLRLLANFGAQSDRADIMTNLVTIAANKPECDIVCIMAGTNDLTVSDPAATIISDITALTDIILAAGKKAIVCSIPPERTDFATATRKSVKEAVHVGLADLASANPGRVAFANAYPDMVDPASPIGASLAGVTFDGLHFADKGGQLMAPAVKTALDQLATYGNVFAPPMLGHAYLKSYKSATGADVGLKGNVTGPVCITGYSATSNARTTAVAEVITDAVTGRFIQRYTITPGGADTLTIYLGNNNAETLTALGCAVGDSLILAAEFKVSGGTAGVLQGITAAVDGYSSEPRIQWATQSSSVAAQNTLTDYQALIVSAPLKILAGQTRIQNTIGLAFLAAGAPVVLEIDRIHLLRKPA